MPFLLHWTKTQVQRFSKSFTLNNYKRNQIVYQQGEKAKMVYIIKNGEFEITRVKKNRASDQKDGN